MYAPPLPALTRSTPLIAPGEHAWTQVPYLEQHPPEGFERAFPCLSSLPPPPASSHSRIWPGLTAVQTIPTARTRHGPRLRRSPAARPLWACEDALARARDPTKHAEGVEEAGRVAGARKHARANVLWRILERRPLRIPLVQPSFLSQQRVSAWLWPTRSLARIEPSRAVDRSVARAGGQSASAPALVRDRWTRSCTQLTLLASAHHQLVLFLHRAAPSPHSVSSLDRPSRLPCALRSHGLRGPPPEVLFPSPTSPHPYSRCGRRLRRGAALLGNRLETRRRLVFGRTLLPDLVLVSRGGLPSAGRAGRRHRWDPGRGVRSRRRRHAAIASSVSVLCVLGPVRIS